MRVFLTGASGFIGGNILRQLSQRGHQVTCLARTRGAEAIDAMQLPGVTTIVGQFTQTSAWQERLRDHDIVINAVGIIRASRRSSFAQIHRDAPVALFEAAASRGVRRIIQISALGADQDATSQYHLTKRDADRRLQAMQVEHLILRPSFVYGPQDQSMTFFQSLAASPITMVPGDGQYLVQPVHVDDLVRAVVSAVETEEKMEVTVDLGGAESLSFDRMLDILARRLGKKQARKTHIPWPLMQLIARVTDGLGFGPITRDELGMLRRGNSADIEPFVSCFGFRPVSFEAGIARKPLTQADRWYSRLKPLRPILRLSIAFIWIATGFVSAFLSVEQGMELLRQIGMTGWLADVALFGTSWLEIALGIATAVGWRVRWMATIQLLLMFGFMLILSLGLPHFWLDPFGPLTKNIPLIGATLVMMAMEE